MSGRFIEATIRSLAIVAGAGAAVAGGFTVNELFTIYGAMTNTNKTASNLINEINPDLILFTQISAGLALSLGGLSLFTVISIFLRVCKCKAGTCIRVIFALDFLIILMCLFGFGTGGALGAIGAHSWTVAAEFLSQNGTDTTVFTALTSPDNLFIFEQTRVLLIATAATSIFASLIFLVLKYWMIVFCSRNCDLEYDSWI